MKKQAEEEFEIFERQWTNRLFTEFKHLPLIRINCAHITYSTKAMDFMQAKLEAETIVAKKGEQWYLAVLPTDSKMRGWRLFKSHNLKNLYATLPKRLKGVIPKGEYEIITEPEFKNGIDWYPLETFTPQNDTLIK